jgi:glycerol-3-phosphate acyltransferase PlsY
MSLIGYLAVAYLLGAFPTAVVVGRAFWKTDVRQHGSGNAGATNAWRVLGWKAGLPVLLIDAGKGAAAAGLVPLLPFGASPVDPRTLVVLCGVAAVIGHVYPVYTRFRGGKGVAAAAGMLIVAAPIPVSLAAGLFAAVVFTSGRVSLGSILAAWSLPVLVLSLPASWVSGRTPALIALVSALAVFITITHRRNIVRLWNGTERVFAGLQLWRRFLSTRVDSRP